MINIPIRKNNQLEAKHLTILEDQMNSEALAYKKCRQYAEYFSDMDSKNVANQLAQIHKQHFQNLLNYLNTYQ